MLCVLHIGGIILKKALIYLFAGLFGVSISFTTVDANASTKIKVLKTRTTSIISYHGKSGNIYKTIKDKKVSYKMKNYRYTTWKSSRYSLVKIGKKKFTMVYIKSNQKKGWINKTYLINGNAPFNKEAGFKSDLDAIRAAAITDHSSTRDNLDASDYYSLSDCISPDYVSTVKECRNEQAFMVQVYNILQKRFQTYHISQSRITSLNKMKDDIANADISSKNTDSFNSSLQGFSNAISDVLNDFN